MITNEGNGLSAAAMVVLLLLVALVYLCSRAEKEVLTQVPAL
ncbi:TPA: hypothetical protein ACPHTW_001516 [Vibrio antiquarius]